MSLTTGTDLASALDRRVAELTRLLRADIPTGRSVTSLLTLRRLDVDGPARVTELAASERVSQPTMTVLLRRLQEDGLVERSADPADGRAVRVALTDAGREELVTVRRARADLLHRRLETLDAGHRAALEAALPALDALLAADPGPRQ
jgi:DNA-binding MarR family transcriptional regulator